MLEPHSPFGYTDGKGQLPSHPDQSILSHPWANDVFVGRQLEMAALIAALGETHSGHSRLVMLVG